MGRENKDMGIDDREESLVQYLLPKRKRKRKKRGTRRVLMSNQSGAMLSFLAIERNKLEESDNCCENGLLYFLLSLDGCHHKVKSMKAFNSRVYRSSSFYKRAWPNYLA